MNVQDLPKGEYELSWFEKGAFQDNHGNYWCNAAFVGVSEPVRWVVKDPQAITVGEKYYGYFTLEKSKAGNAYLRFRREQKPEVVQSELIGSTAEKKWQPRDDNAIRAQWAIGQAFSNKPEGIPLEKVEEIAKQLYAMVDRVKGDDSPKADAPRVGLTPEEEVAQRQAKADAERIRNTFSDGTPIPDEVFPVEDEPIDLSAIPF